MSLEFTAKHGLISKNNSVISGSLIVTNGVTASLYGSSSYSTTASYALNGGGLSLVTGSTYPITASYALTASFFPAISGSNLLYLQCSDGNTYPVTLFNEYGNIVLQIGQTPVTGTNNFLNIGTVNNFTTGSTYPITASYAASSSAAGITGQINAQVQEWTATVAQITSSYPSGTPLGVLAYATDANSLRIGDGTTIGGIPTGVRYLKSIINASFSDGKIGELVTATGTSIPADQLAVSILSSTGSFSTLAMNVCSSSGYASWTPIITYENGLTNNLINPILGISELNVVTPIIYMDYGTFGINTDYESYGVPAYFVSPLINIINGSGGNSPSGSVGKAGSGQPIPSIIAFINGNGGNSDNNTLSFGGDASAISNMIVVQGGSGGDASNGGVGGYGGTINSIFYSKAGSGGNATGSGAVGGNGGSSGGLTSFGGYGASVSGSGLTGGSGGNAGNVTLNGGNASASIWGGTGGYINTSANGIYSGGNITTQASTFRNGGSISTFVDSYSPVTIFTISQSVGSVNTSALINFWTGSNVKSFNTTGSLDVINPYIIDHAGRTMCIKTQGYMYSNGTDALQLQLHCGSNIIWNSSPLTASNTNGTSSWKYEGQYTFNTLIGTTSSLLNGQGQFTYFNTPSSSIQWCGIPNTASYSINLSLQNEVVISATWTSASLANGIWITDGVCELKN